MGWATQYHLYFDRKDKASAEQVRDRVLIASISENHAQLRSGEKITFNCPWTAWKAAQQDVSGPRTYIALPGAASHSTYYGEEGDDERVSPLFKHPVFQEDCFLVLIDWEQIETENYVRLDFDSILKDTSTFMGLGDDSYQVDKLWLSQTTRDSNALFGLMTCDYSARLVLRERSILFKDGLPANVKWREMETFVPWAIRELGNIKETYD